MRRLCVILALLACMLAPGALAENRALLVGCDSFVTQADTSPSSGNNVNRMAQALEGGKLQLERTVTSHNAVTTPADLQALIREAFADADEDDVSYFYVSTHGVWEQGQPNEEMTLLFSDGVAECGVTARMLRDMFDEIPGTKVLILDACHAGAVIGKGVHAPFDNVFAGSDYKVICSSGGAEQSWFWSAREDDETSVGAGYFSGALVNGISARGNFGADSNGDGAVTLTELKRYLRDHHGASTVQTYPEEDDFVLMTYATSSSVLRHRGGAITGLSFDEDVLSPDRPEATFSFTVLRPVQLAYQMVYQRNGSWDFDHSDLLYDNAERFGEYGDAPGFLSPGMKERTLTLNDNAAEQYGYALLQMVTQSAGLPELVSSRVLCVPPAQGDPALLVTVQDAFCPGEGGELGLVVHHAFPCELTVTVVDADGATVRRLASRQATRPQQLTPRGSTFCWNGRLADGTQAAPGEYRVRVRAYVGEEVFEAESVPFLLAEPVG